MMMMIKLSRNPVKQTKQKHETNVAKQIKYIVVVAVELNLEISDET